MAQVQRLGDGSDLVDADRLVELRLGKSRLSFLFLPARVQNMPGKPTIFEKPSASGGGPFAGGLAIDASAAAMIE